MKQNQKNRYGGRYNNSRSGRSQTIFRNTVLESSGPCGKLHGTALQLFEKYQAAAKDALLQNDLILSESCLQYADHYMRLQNTAIANEQALRANNAHNHYAKPQSEPQQEQKEETSVAVPSDNTLPETAVDTTEESKNSEEVPAKSSSFKPRRRPIARNIKKTEQVVEKTENMTADL